MKTSGSRQQGRGPRGEGRNPAIPGPRAPGPSPGKWIEIVGWRRAQPKMKASPNSWLKLYCSLLDDHRYQGFDNATRVLLTGLWMLAARLGKHVLPADPKWLHKRMPMLREEPDLEPLLNARDIYDRPDPFIRYCDAPSAQDGQEREFEPDGQQGAEGAGSASGRKSGAGAGHPDGRGKKKAAGENKPQTRTGVKEKNPKPKRDGTDVATRTRARSTRERAPAPRASACALRAREKTRVEESRVEKTRRDTETLTGFGKTEKKSATLTGCLKGQSTAQQSSPEHIAATAQQSSPEPEKPENPMESEAGEAKAHIVPRPPPSVKGAGPQRLGQILCERFPDHWSDPDAEAFGWEIVEALGMPRDPHNMNIRSEWGAFAKWWWRVKQAAPMRALGELRAMAVGKAVWIHAGPKRPKNVRNPRALWTDIMDKEMVHHGIRLPDARDGPAAGIG